jgi:hypothetical protein
LKRGNYSGSSFDRQEIQKTGVRGGVRPHAHLFFGLFLTMAKQLRKEKIIVEYNYCILPLSSCLLTSLMIGIYSRGCQKGKRFGKIKDK